MGSKASAAGNLSNKRCPERHCKLLSLRGGTMTSDHQCARLWFQFHRNTITSLEVKGKNRGHHHWRSDSTAERLSKGHIEVNRSSRECFAQHFLS